VAGAPDLVEQAGPGIAQVFLLELDERGGALMVVAGDLQAEAVRLVLRVPGEGEEGGESAKATRLKSSAINGSEATSESCTKPNRSR